jgi:hypothetical protein
VISLINSEAIQPGCYGGTDDRSGHQQGQDKDEETQADPGRFPMFDLLARQECSRMLHPAE